VAIGIGDLSLTYQCLRCANAIDPGHVEASNNLGGEDEERKETMEREMCGFLCACVCVCVCICVCIGCVRARRHQTVPAFEALIRKWLNFVAGV